MVLSARFSHQAASSPERTSPRRSESSPITGSEPEVLIVTISPARFESIGHARAWMDGFIGYYNHEHYHSGIGCCTPASVHHGAAETVRQLRQNTLDTTYAEHPERFARRPTATKLPTVAHINDPARRRPNQPNPNSPPRLT